MQPFLMTNGLFYRIGHQVQEPELELSREVSRDLSARLTLSISSAGGIVMHGRGASFFIRTQASCSLPRGRGCMGCVGGRCPAAPARQAAALGGAAGGSGRGTLAAVRLLRGGGCWRSGAARARIAISPMWRSGWLRRGQRRCG